MATKEELIAYIPTSKYINQIKELPLIINKNNIDFKLYINIFENRCEINYYSEDKLEFLFPVKIFNDFNVSVKNIICNLKKI